MNCKKILIPALIALFCTCTSHVKEIKVNVTNNTSIDRGEEIVEIPWTNVRQLLSISEGQSIIVTDSVGKQIPYQLITNGTDSIESLIFLASTNAQQTVKYNISIGEPEHFAPMVYGRLISERKDDFAWENNRTAFRVYGPALQETGEISNGMDMWEKRTDKLIIDEWYKNELSGKASYHVDHGEGLDFYTVGRTLGLGMTAPFNDDTLCLGNNFVTAEILDKGPLRIKFKLTYAPYMAGQRQISETRIISLDAYSLFNRVTNIFETEGTADDSLLTVATGIVMTHTEPQVVFGDKTEGIIAYELPEDKENGTIYTAAFNNIGFKDIRVADDHYLGINNYSPGTCYTYYAGGGWSKAGFNNGFESWVEFVKKEKTKIDHPLLIKIN